MENRHHLPYPNPSINLPTPNFQSLNQYHQFGMHQQTLVPQPHPQLTNTRLEPSSATMRQNNEMERLRLRMLLLEQQMQNQPPPSSSSSSVASSSTPYSGHIDEYLASLVRTQLNTSLKNTEDRVKQLDALLNQREYEIKEMKSKFGAETQRLESEMNQLKSTMNSREEELLSEKMRYSSLQKEHEKLKLKLNDTNKYLSELATKEETRALQDELREAHDEIDRQKDELKTCESKLAKAKAMVKEKIQEIKEGKEAVEREKLAREKLRIEFESYKQKTNLTGEIVEKLEQNASLSAELECAKKLLSGMQEKISHQQVSHDKQVKELRDSLKQQTDINASLRSDLDKKESIIRELQISLKSLAFENEQLSNTNTNLTEKLKSFDALVGAESIKMLRVLLKEMNCCASELESLVQTCSDINEGKEIDCCKFLGSATRKTSDYIDLTGSNESVLNLINSDQLLKKINDLRELKKKLKELKTMIADRVAEKIGSNVSCITQ